MNKEEVSTKGILRSLNFNVKIFFLFSILASFGRGIWMGNVLSTYIYLIAEESSQILGLTSMATGITMTIVVFPAGYLADRFRRDIMLKIAAVIGTAALFIVFFGHTIITILIALLLWGFYQGLTRPSLESIFADSVKSGHRSRIYSWAHFARQFAMASGPFINVGLFLLFGDEWGITILRSVMGVGLIITLVSLLVMLIFNDQKALGDQSESIAKEMTLAMEEKTNGYFSKMDLQKRTKLIPILLVTSNIIIGFGAGMTIKFFPIFFIKIYDLSPVWVQLIMGTTSIFTGLSGLLAQQFSLRRGRAQMIFLVQTLATICLGLLAIYPPILFLVPLFIARGSLMNASQPLSRSILMDMIPKNKRGRWNSLQTIAWGLFWNVSAGIGGFLIGDNNNFRLCFLVTMGLYFLGEVPILMLIPLLGREKIAKKEFELVAKNIDRSVIWAARNYGSSILETLYPNPTKKEATKDEFKGKKSKRKNMK
ncbi:MAG: MFS transporter [Candidatus Heimdallarchaeota archaeon]|nr:MFS transporter [Candidatus Heimdallarchaeota archaeon]